MSSSVTSYLTLTFGSDPYLFIFFFALFESSFFNYCPLAVFQIFVSLCWEGSRVYTLYVHLGCSLELEYLKGRLVSPDRTETELKPNKTVCCVESIRFWVFEHARLLEPCRTDFSNFSRGFWWFPTQNRPILGRNQTEILKVGFLYHSVLPIGFSSVGRH